MSRVQIFRARHLITCNSQRDIWDDAFLAVEKEKIIDLGPWKKRPRLKSSKEEDLSFGMIMPGLFNLHTHLPMTLLRGIIEDVDFETWLFKTILPIESKWVGPEFVRVGTELGLLESIRFGVIFVADMYLYEMEIAKAIDRFGLRGFAGQHVWDWKAPDYETKEQAFEGTIPFVKKFKDHPRVLAGIAPHAPYSCSPQTLKEAADFAKEYQLRTMIHVAETETELKNMKAQYNKTPLELVKDSGLYEVPHLLIAHAVWPEPADFAALSTPNVTTVINSQCNAKLASGIAPVQKYKEKNIRFGIGTDGPASNNALDIFSELNFLSKIHHVSEKNLTGLPGIEILEAATIRAAEAVGIQDKTGSLEIGKDADFIVIDLRSPHLNPVTNPINLLINGVRGQDVHSTYVQGRALMKDRKFLSANAPQVISRAEKFWKKIKSAMD